MTSDCRRPVRFTMEPPLSSVGKKAVAPTEECCGHDLYAAQNLPSNLQTIPGHTSFSAATLPSYHNGTRLSRLICLFRAPYRFFSAPKKARVLSIFGPS